MLEAIITVGAPFVVNWITGLTKTYALSRESSVLLVRTLVAVFSLLAAVGTLLIGGQVPDLNGLVNTVILTFFNFMAATGIFHLRK